MGLQNWWDRHGVPRVIKFACGMPVIADLRKQIIPMAKGKVFELGCGGGYNQEYYNTSAVTGFSAIDPNDKLRSYAHAAAQEKGWQADIREGVGENIPFGDEVFDTVVCTYTLCSVTDPSKVLHEMRRIQKPGGKMLFLEHGRSPDKDVARWQGRIEPFWKPIGGGCHLTREVSGAICEAGFAVEMVGAQYLEKTPRSFGWTEWGVATKQGA